MSPSVRRITWLISKIIESSGKIDKVDYFEHQSHRGLEVFWAPQSSVCVVENDARYGADSISALEINNLALLKQRSAIGNTAPSTEEECKLMESLIKALQELVW